MEAAGKHHICQRQTATTEHTQNAEDLVVIISRQVHIWARFAAHAGGAHLLPVSLARSGDDEDDMVRFKRMPNSVRSLQRGSDERFVSGRLEKLGVASSPKSS